MKIVKIFLAAIGLWSVAACFSSPDDRSVQADAGTSADNLEMQANAFQMRAETAANGAAAAMIENAAGDLNEPAHNAGDAAGTATDNLQQ